MKKRVVLCALAMLLAVGLLPALCSPARAAYFYTDTGGNDVSVFHASSFYIVNSDYELWSFDFPDGASVAASSKKITDGAKQVVAELTNATVLKTNGEVWTYNYSSGTLSNTGIKNVASLAGDAGSYITTDGRLMFKKGNEYICVDTDVKTAVAYSDMWYIKNNGDLHVYKKSVASGVMVKNVEKLYADQSTCFAITADKDLYAWGSTRYGQTGVPANASTFVPMYISVGGGNPLPDYYVTEPTLVMKNIEKVIPDTAVTRVVTTDGRVLSWGGGDQIEDPDVITPRQLTEDQWMAKPLAVYFTEHNMAYYTKRQVIQYDDGTLVLKQPKQVRVGMAGVEVTFPEHSFILNMTLLSLSGAQPAPPAPPAPSAWAADAAAWALASDELGPVFDGAWQDIIRRDQFAAITVVMAEQALGKALPAAPASTFADTSDKYVLKAYQAGIVTGTSATTFDPQGLLTREQLATMLFRAIKYIEAETGSAVLAKAGTLDKFGDRAQVSTWAADAVAALAANDIMKGTGETTLSPKSTANIEQALVLAHRVLGGLK